MNMSLFGVGWRVRGNGMKFELMFYDSTFQMGVMRTVQMLRALMGAMQYV